MTICNLTGPYTYDPNIVVLWVPSINNIQIPTGGEIVTGTDLTSVYCLTDIVGWEAGTETIRDGIWGPFEEQRMGRQSIQESQLAFAADVNGNDVRTLWTRGQVGNIVLMPSGSYASHPLSPINVYPVRVSQLTQLQRLRTGGASIILVSFIIRSRLGENVTVTP